MLTDQMSQPTSSVASSKREPKSDCNCKFFAFQASHENKTNWHLQYKEQDKSVKIQGDRKKILHSCVSDLILLPGPGVTVVPRQGKRVALTEHGYVVSA